MKAHNLARRVAIFISSALLCGPALAANSCEREMARAARVHNVPLSVFYAVGLTETGRKGSLQPYAMNIEGKAYFGASVADGLRRFDEAKRQNIKLIDIGCMQINHHYHGRNFRSVAEMFDPARNVEYAALFLKKLRERESTWTLAVARYHAGPDNNPAQKRYVCAVIANMVATGFGAWTPNARAFCQPPAVSAARPAPVSARVATAAQSGSAD